MEIVIIIGAVILIFMLTRVARRNKHTPGKHLPSADSADIGTSKPGPGTSHKLRRVGLLLLIVGIVILLAEIGLFRWAIRASLWSLVIVGAGLALLFLSRGK